MTKPAVMDSFTHDLYLNLDNDIGPNTGYVVLRVIFSYLVHPFRPRLTLICWRELYGVSFWLWITGMAGFVNDSGLTLIVGRFVDAKRVGFFNVGQEMGQLPNTELLHPLTAVLFPGLSRVGDDPARFNNLFRDEVIPCWATDPSPGRAIS